MRKRANLPRLKEPYPGDEFVRMAPGHALNGTRSIHKLVKVDVWRLNGNCRGVGSGLMGGHSLPWRAVSIAYNMGLHHPERTN